MFGHNFKYSLLTGLRSKEVVFWLILFPIALGTLFKMAFGNLYEDLEFSAIKIAVVEENGRDETLRTVLEGISEGEDAIFDVEYTDSDDALKKLENEDVKGVIYASDELKLTVSSNGVAVTTLESFVERYNLNIKIIGDTAKNNPEKIPEVAAALSEEISTVKAEALSKGNTNIYDQYFYNLIAMVALFGFTPGLFIAIENQGNLSALGARKCVSPTPKSVTILAALAATFLIQTICMIIAVSYIRFVLQVDMGNRLGLFYLTAILAGTVGSSVGFMLGSIGRGSVSTKSSIASAVTMILCFLSGLMDGSMKQKVAESAPWFNKINPAAVICESLFSLNIYEDYRRYTQGIVTMVIMTLLFVTMGFMMTRRRRYASL